MTNTDELIKKWNNEFSLADNTLGQTTNGLITAFLEDLKALQSSEVDVDKLIEELLDRSMSKYRKEGFIEVRKDLLKIIINEHLTTSKVKEEVDYKKSYLCELYLQDESTIKYQGGNIVKLLTQEEYHLIEDIFKNIEPMYGASLTIKPLA